MKQQVERSVTSSFSCRVFRGREILFVIEEGESYVLVRTLCDAIGLDAACQIRHMKYRPPFSKNFRKITLRVPGDTQRRQWTCLKEEFVPEFVFGVKQANSMPKSVKEALTTFREMVHLPISVFLNTKQ